MSRSKNDDTVETMDLDTLCRVAGQILELDGATASDARVRSQPDGRTLRYYSTIGLLDRPARKGRVGHYGRRHLLQTLAIKRLQAGGASLAEVQSHLIGLTPSELEGIARMPRDFDLEAAIGGKTAPEPAPPRRNFWAVIPEEDEAAHEPKSGSVAALRLGGGAVLLLPGKALSETEQAELEQAAQPLLEALRRQQRTS